jgi:hypothetical protein
VRVMPQGLHEVYVLHPGRCKVKLTCELGRGSYTTMLVKLLTTHL